MLTKTKREAVRRRYKALRAVRGLNQKQVEAEAVKLAGRYWKIENGWVDPTPKERKALASVLRVAESDLPEPFGVEAKAS